MKSASRSAIRKFSMLSGVLHKEPAASSHQPLTFLGSHGSPILLIIHGSATRHEEMVQRIGTRKRQLARRVAWALGPAADFWLQNCSWLLWWSTIEKKWGNWWKTMKLDGKIHGNPFRIAGEISSQPLKKAPKMLSKLQTFFSQLSRTRKLIVVRCIRPDRVLPAVQVFVVPCRYTFPCPGTVIDSIWWWHLGAEDHMD